MKKATDILAEISSDAAVRRRAEEREVRLKLDAMFQREAIDEARDEGRNEGRDEGRDEATADTLLLVVEARFGAVPAELRARIEAMNVIERRAMITRAAVVASIDDLLGD